MVRFVVPLKPGSSAASWTPRIDAIGSVPLQVAGQEAPPSQMKLKFAPPSVDSKSPNGGLGVGGLDVAPPLETELTPRTPRADAT